MPGLARCSRRSNCYVGLDRALITSQSWTRCTLAPSSGPASCSRPWRSHVDGIHCHCCIPRYAPRPSLDRSQSSRSSGWVHGRRARGEPHPGRPTDGVRILSSFTVRRLLFFSDVQAERVEEGGSSVAGRRGRRKAIVPCRMAGSCGGHMARASAASPSVPWW